MNINHSSYSYYYYTFGQFADRARATHDPSHFPPWPCCVQPPPPPLRSRIVLVSSFSAGCATAILSENKNIFLEHLRFQERVLPKNSRGEGHTMSDFFIVRYFFFSPPSPSPPPPPPLLLLLFFFCFVCECYICRVSRHFRDSRIYQCLCCLCKNNDDCLVCLCGLVFHLFRTEIVTGNLHAGGSFFSSFFFFFVSGGWVDSCNIRNDYV